MNKYYEGALLLGFLFGTPYLAHHIGNWAMRRAHRKGEEKRED